MQKHIKDSKNRLIQLLRSFEHFTKTDNVYLAKNGTLLICTQAVSVLNGFVLYILISHFLTKEIYGQYKYFLSLFSLFSLTTFTGMEVAVLRAVAQGNDGAVEAGFKRKLMGGAIGSLLSCLAAAYYTYNGRADLALALIMMAIFAPWIYAANVYSSAFSGKKKFSSYTKINIATTLLAFVFMAIAFITVRNPVWLFLAFLVTSSTSLIAYYIARQTLTNTNIGKDTFSFGTHLTKLDILGTIANNIDGILIFHFLGATSLAIYTFAIIPVEQMKGFLKSVQSIAMPKFSINSIAHTRTTIQRKIKLFMLGIAILMAVYILLAPSFFKFFFPAYTESILYSQVYCLSLIFAMPASLLVTLFMAKGLKKETTLFNVINYSIQIILLIFGAWLYGLWGAIAARTISRVLMLFTTHTMIQRAKDLPEEM